MWIAKPLCFICALLIINVQVVTASTILGKIAVYQSQSRSNIYPLVAAKKMSFNHRALVRLPGATLITTEDTEFEALEEERGIVLSISRGEVYFKILPEKSAIKFKTPHGVFASPDIVRASTNTTTGKIDVAEVSTTVELAEGELRVLSAKGLSSLSSGQKIKLAQARLEEAPAPPENLEELIKKTGKADSLLGPEGTVDVEANIYDAVVVDDNLEPIEEAQLGKGTEIVVKGVRDTTLLVQPVDRSLIAAWLQEEGLTKAEIAAYIGFFSIVTGTAIAVPIAITQADDEEASPIGEE